ncbi:hypothetical protein C453_00980 [Haloferax elongans ATCC BAA-1513]|uniref:Uncharacterized protein n=1 Tax=Haloferax elongans ATCC BAA-1513 TaxID=1230453 RepID=M0HYI2_HALEO|nr:hypothetical protein [Haloferax elongans]ELZ88793.1 hypothetical protein C453_00980 [Haloferax elongans ATCC BAA-1513]
MTTKSIPTKYRKSEGQYVFHTTETENIDSILDKGVDPMYETGPDTTAAADVLSHLAPNEPFPFDRTTVAYCHTDSEYVGWLIEQQQQDHGFISDNSYAVIDVTKIDAPKYISDMKIVSDLIDYKYGGSNVMLCFDTAREALAAYRESIQPVDSPSDIETYDSGIKDSHPELIVSGIIPPEAIVDVLD